MKVNTYEEIYGKKITIKELIDSFEENTKTGEVVAFAGKLNVRPSYQREFVYTPEKQRAVIDTILKGYPLNVMYWAKLDDHTYELMDGQQRTLSICKFADDQYSITLSVAGKPVLKTFSNLGSKENDFLDYPLTIYICEGNEDEKLEWFRIINIAGLKLTEQEMRNAIYNGPWVADAKKYFSRIDGEGYSSEGHISNGHTYGDYIDVVGGTLSDKERAVVRQKLLEIVLGWAVDAYNLQFGRKEDIDSYMYLHRQDANAKELWRYYEDVMEWVKETFPTYRNHMVGVEWGLLYNKYHNNTPVNADNMANIIFEKASEEISNPKGVYEAVLSNNMKFIHARNFKPKDIEKVAKQQNWECPYCHKQITKDNMQGDHIKPWSKGGTTELDNLQVLCPECNIKKSAYDVQFNPYDGKDYTSFDLDTWDKKD